ncbi:MAG: DNA photolyase family protein [Bacteroidetes bacterium]|nr:DNA photolyase family protein [Bacteroidota bacterium]
MAVNEKPKPVKKSAVEIAIMWFRRDLRLKDNAALYHALRSGYKVLPVFIFDSNILDDLAEKKDPRVEFIMDCLTAMQASLKELGSGLVIKIGKPLSVWQELLREYSITAVYSNRDYEQYAIQRDAAVADLLRENQVDFQQFKDQVIFDQNEVVKDNGDPYTVFTPYSRKWLQTLTNFQLNPYPTERYVDQFLPSNATALPSLTEIGFAETGFDFPSKALGKTLLTHYQRDRDFPALTGTSKLGIHLRFGTISIRALAAYARQYSDTYLKELIWREFYQMILFHFPQVNEGRSFKKEYDRIQWRHDEKDFHRWCEGKTGYPLVDAGMRELNATGFMHNRVRMVTASFLAKHLLIDWRWGEAYFASKLLDYDFASNNGGWQWAVGCGCDAAPYFRIFNPSLQAKKFDPDNHYIHHWVPEMKEASYVKPMVDHEMARKRCLETFSKALK